MSTLILIPALILAGFAVLALISSTLYWYERINSPEPRIPSPQPGLFTLVRHYLATFRSYVRCAVLLPFGRKLHRKPLPAAPGQKPAVLIHGLYNNAAVWLYLGRVLEKAGYAISTYNYSSHGPTPEAIVQGLDAHIRAVESPEQGGKPVLIGHSFGGIVARRWLQRPENAGRIAALVTLGAPHRGSKVAALGHGPLVRHLRPGSPFLQELEAGKNHDSAICVSLISPEDDAVLPASCLLPPETWRFVVTRPLPHFSLLFSRSAAKQLLCELGRLGA